MHMADGRPLIFARKPAPVQVAWLAYPGTTGLSAMDYRLTDPYLDPPGLNDQFYSETSIRLPDTFWCYDPLNTELAVSALPAQSHGHVTFGCLNNFCKVNERVLRLWARVLKAVDRSRMMILCPEGSHRQPLLELLATRGDRTRSDRVGRPPAASEYLELYHRIDVGTGHLSIQRPHHEPGLILDGRSGRDAGGQDGRWTSRAVAIDQSRPAGTDRPDAGTICADRRGACRGFASIWPNCAAPCARGCRRRR